MTAKETLIEINTSLQAIGASRTRKYFTDEIEWYVNKMQLRFIQNCLRKKGSDQTAYLRSEGEQNMFEIDEIYRDAIKALLKEAYLPADYYTNSGRSAQVSLPVDYSYALDFGVNADLCTTFRYSKLVNRSSKIVGIAFPNDSTASDKHYFDTLTLKKDAEIIYSHNGYYNYPDAFQVIEEIQGIYTTISGDQVSVAVGNIGGYFNNNYILIMGPNDASVYTLNYEPSALVTLASTLLKVVTTKSSSADPAIIDGRPMDVIVNIPARSVNNSNTYGSGTTSYYKTSDKEVTTKINGSVILIDTATNFIVNGIVLSYVRKPRRFSVSLNNGLEIAPEFHNQICDMTVNHIRERIGDPKYQTGLLDYKQA